MNGLIEFAQKLRAQIDIVRVVEGYVELRRGGANLKGLCPLHKEKTPSFTVSPAKQIFHCFGCSEGGDVIRFIEKVERLEWKEAVRLLAERHGIAIPEFHREPGARGQTLHDSARENLLAINRLATQVFADQLQEACKSPECEIAQYLDRRGIDAQTAARFGLGLAADAWSRFLDAGRKAGFKNESMVSSGLVIFSQQSNRHYDRFRKRLMYPICDAVGRPIAFGGRVYAKDASPDEPKYVNSPETALYRKGQHLYALHLAKDTIARARQAILMEGYMDVIRAHQHGFTNAVASCGTALTDEQARALRKLCQEIVFVYDGDDAGRKAMLRGCETLLDHGFIIRVVILPDNHDPDSFLAERGADAFRDEIARARDFLDFAIETAAAAANPRTTTGKVEIVDSVLPLLRKITNPIARADCVHRVAEFLSVDEALISRQLSDSNPRNFQRLKEMVEARSSDDCRRDRMLLKLAVESPAARPRLFESIKTDWVTNPLVRKWLNWCQLRDSSEEITWQDLLACCKEDEDATFLRSLALDDAVLDHSDQTIEHLMVRMQFHYRRQQTELLAQKISEFFQSNPGGEDYVELARDVDENSPVKTLGNLFFLPHPSRKKKHGTRN
jgi:DNA primase